MPERQFYLDFGKAVIVGLVSIVGALVVLGIVLGLLFLFWKPVLAGLMTGIGIITLILGFIALVVVIAAGIYFLAGVGTAVMYFNRTADVSKEKKGYSLNTTEEAGLRQTGSSDKGGE